MKAYIHLLINACWVLLFFVATIFVRRGFFTVPEMLDIGLGVDIVIVFVILHMIFILLLVKQLKVLNLFFCLVTLCIYLFYPISFNPF